MQEVRVDRKRGFAALVAADRDLVRLSEFQEFGAAGELPLAPWRDDAHIGFQSIIGEFEADLVVTLSGGAVGDGVGAGCFGDFDLPLRDERAGNGGAEQVLALVECIGAEHWEDEVAGKRLAQVFDEDLAHPGLLGLPACGFQLLALAEIGGEGHHFASVGRLQPTENDAGVEATRVGEHHLLYVFVRCCGTVITACRIGASRSCRVRHLYRLGYRSSGLTAHGKREQGTGAPRKT